MSKWQSLLAPLRRTRSEPIRVDGEDRSRFEYTLRSRDGISEEVIQAMLAVPRVEFVGDRFKEFAYDDNALPIGSRGTISQPSLVGKMVTMLHIEAGHAGVVLDVGSGSGYTSAILSSLAAHVIAVERVETLASECEARLNRLGFTNIDVVVASEDVLGYPDRAPYDAILVSAGAPDVPKSLAAQLAPGARMVIPIGERYSQRLAVVERVDAPGQFTTTYSSECRFVPLIGPEAWPAEALDIP